MVKKLYLRLKESFWVIPVMYCLIALFLTVGIILVDYDYYNGIDRYIPEFFYTNAELGKDILGVIAGALLTMTAITFSTIMIVLTTYSSQFSPRTLQNFLTDRRTLTVLGVFMGGFLYSIISLLFLRVEFEDKQILAATFSVMLSLICLGFFAFFIQHVATFIQVSNLISSITEEAKRNLETYHQKVEKSEVIKEKANPIIPSEFKIVSKVVSPRYGYLQIIDYDHLFEIAKKEDWIIQLKQEIGSFVVESTVIAEVFQKEESRVPDELINAFTLGRERNASEDVQYTIQKLEEISLRAISSGINDPHTAIDCIQHLGKILLLIIKYHKEHLVYEDHKQVRVITKQRQMRDILYQSFYQVIDHMGKDVSILFVIMDTLILIGEESDERVRLIIRDLYDYLKSHFKMSELKAFDRYYFEQKEHRLLQL
ncbi:DUF2254 domain-containing protein [Piscibacillus halophilus]|nr:DUF2254 domain-containing protein [Piscibacillus halophilus]